MNNWRFWTWIATFERIESGDHCDVIGFGFTSIWNEIYAMYDGGRCSAYFCGSFWC